MPTRNKKQADAEKTKITLKLAKELLGWSEVEKNPDLKIGSKGYKLEKNLNNRPIYRSHYLKLKQEITKMRWRYNGEPIIIGKKGTLLNGQHTLIALVLSCMEYEEDPEASELWDETPFITKMIVYGIEENDETINTMDTCKPRSLADAIYRSEYFRDMKESNRKKVSRITDYAIRTLWHRTGVNLDGTKKTHAESLDFLEAHPSLLGFVKHVFEENGKDKRLKQYLEPGLCAGMLYLMAASNSKFHEYYDDQYRRTESNLDWENGTRAEDFFTMLASGAVETRNIGYVIANLSEEGEPTMAEKLAVIIKAWNAFSSGKKVTRKNLQLRYIVDEDGYKTLVDKPTVGGIDMGDPQADAVNADTDDEEEDEIPEEVIPKKTSNKKIKRKMIEGDEVNVHEDDEDSEDWKGTLVEYGPTISRVKPLNGYAGAGNTYEVKTRQLTPSK